MKLNQTGISILYEIYHHEMHKSIHFRQNRIVKHAILMSLCKSTMGILHGVTLSFTLKKVSHLPVIPLVWAIDEEDDRLNICSLHMQGQIPPSHHITFYTRERNPADVIFDFRSMLWLQLQETLY